MVLFRNVMNSKDNADDGDDITVLWFSGGNGSGLLSLLAQAKFCLDNCELFQTFCDLHKFLHKRII